MEHQYLISDPQVLKVVAHPLRVRLLGLLRAEGPATASQLGRKVDESSGSTSYHLRELAKYGFIEEDPSEDGRERRWRARHQFTSWDPAQMSATPEGREAVAIMEARQLDGLARAMREHRDTDWPPEWRATPGMSDFFAYLNPEGVQRLFDRIAEIKEELERDYAEGAEQVSVYIAAYPRRMGGDPS
ncbi:winged helix-turn-helix domain-containing protein [Nonomuraea sp. NPDC050310]|uniref:winged helix-turn-helix domain-containing protein n=1 Tax=unclassified Nonomuraea TaxID=2593643 RepID=UPI0033DE3DF5